ncbi:MAG: alpha/beta hydrolase fold domain-containing protein [Paenibacillus sp.]|nr:alpha/beta hydrolase fold domain-containing protein [Paenibacillus sp.]
MSGEVNCVVILAHYSLSPEVRYPVAVEECYSVFEWATNPDNASKLFFDPTKVAMGGDSAGASLTISISGKSSLQNRDSISNKFFCYSPRQTKKFKEQNEASNSLLPCYLSKCSN